MKTAAAIATFALLGSLAFAHEGHEHAPAEEQVAEAPAEEAAAPEEAAEEPPYDGEEPAEEEEEEEAEEEETGKYDPEAEGGEEPAAEEGQQEEGEAPATPEEPAEAGEAEEGAYDGEAPAEGGQEAGGSSPDPDGNATNPDPDAGSGAPPAPVYDDESQKKCGTLYVDVLRSYLTMLLEGVEEPVINQILEYLSNLLTTVTQMDKANPESVTQVVSQVTEMVDYCDENIPDDAGLKTQVVEVLTSAQDTYNNVYDAHVDPQVYNAFEGLWDACKQSTHEEVQTYVEQFHGALTGYVQAGQTDAEYTTDIEHLCKAEDENVQLAAQETKDSVTTLSEEAEAYSAASTIAVGAVTLFGAFLSAIL